MIDDTSKKDKTNAESQSVPPVLPLQTNKPLKEKTDQELLAMFASAADYHPEILNKAAEELGNRNIDTSHLWTVVRPTKKKRYKDYKDIPWSRRSSVNTAFILLGFLGCLPLGWWTLYNLISGYIYYNKKEADGTWKTWSYANKVLAFIIVIVNIIYICLIGMQNTNHIH